MNMSVGILHYPNRFALMAALADKVVEELQDALNNRGSATLAVPGGTTPGPFLAALSQTDLDWARINVMLTDERFVPETSLRSNTRLLRSTLLQNKAQAARFIPFYAPADAPEDVLENLCGAVQGALPLDVCVLGMGEDMHTASLFPGADRLASALSPAARPLMAMRAPGAPEPRITLTAPVLQGAGSTHVLITGAAKLAALERAQGVTDMADAPVRCVLASGQKISVHYAA